MRKKLLAAFLLFLFCLSLLAFDVPHVQAAAMNSNTVGATTSLTATEHGYGRKTYIWNNSALVFYTDGTDAVMRSSRNGSTWSSATVIRASVTYGWFIYFYVGNTTNKLHYIFNNETAGASIYYRRGTLSGSGTNVAVSWDAAEQTAIAGTPTTTYYPCGVVTDSADRAFIVFGNFSATLINAAPMVDRQSAVGPAWTSSPGYPMQLNTSAVDDLPSISIASLSSGRMAFIWSVGSNTTKLQHRLLYSSTLWTSVANISVDNTYDNLPYSIVGESSTAYGNVHFSYVNGSGYTKYGKVQYFSLSGYTLAAEQDIVSGTTTPTISVTSDGASIRIFRTSGTSLMIFQKVNSLFSDYVLAVDSSTIKYDSVQVSPVESYGKFGVAYTISGYVKYVLLPSAFWYELHGPYTEEFMLATSAVNTTAYGIFPTVSFTLNDNMIFYSDVELTHFSFEWASNTREYWFAPNEYNMTIYAFEADATTNSYQIAFVDLAGILDLYPYVEAKRYINGSLLTVEKRKVDLDHKVLMSLVEGFKYTISIESESASYVFGDLLMTATTSVQLTLKGIEFPANIILAYKYVRMYADRHNNLTSISMIYEDTLLATTQVNASIYFQNGTIAYSSLQVGVNSFNVTWTSAWYNTSYYSVMTATHATFGQLVYRTPLPRAYSTSPWGLDWLGSMPLGTSTSVLIPMFIVLCAMGVFSRLNAYVGMFVGVAATGLLAWIGWLPLASFPWSLIFTALVFTIIYALGRKRRGVLGE